ncbi:ExbD/TolR family protein [Psychroserpens luteus]|uniref:ExbD/TolR family protein n=1 Tax=Psychroserpens luteus TaxID=1434066 RepID=A0ABW5ZWJ1_9FLAO|nr:biopolymer transporter ExbD [Psychroserpens luteus]
MKRNLKLFIYIGIGIVLLVTLFYFQSLTNKIEKNNSIDLLVPLITANDSIENNNSVVVKINKDLIVFINDIEYDIKDTEEVLLEKAVNDDLTIVLRAEKSVPIENIVNFMDMANKNSFKVILAVKPSN